MIDLNATNLLLVLDEDTAKKVWAAFKGCRIYFPKCKCEHDEIQLIYKTMMSSNVKKCDAYKRLATMFEKSEGQIRNIVSKQGGLFDD